MYEGKIMELIRKCISLNPHISRHGSLIPYLAGESSPQGDIIMDDYSIDISSYSESGNWGAFPYDINIDKCKTFVTNSGRVVKPTDLKKFFDDNRLSFDVLSTTYYNIRNRFNEIRYFKRILKNGELKWVGFLPSFYEKLDIKTTTSLPETADEHDRIGVYENYLFEEYDFVNLYEFLLKAMGIFVVNDIYVKQDNGVPETMYYTGIKGYLLSMESFKDSNICCKTKEYEFLGGDVFYSYLKKKQNEIDKEIYYWYNAIYRDDAYNVIPPFITIPVALNCDCHTVGMYTSVPNTDEGEMPSDGEIVEINTSSPLKYLRRSKISYCTEIKNGVEVAVEMPVILDEKILDENNVVQEYELTQPYQVGYVKNLSKGDGGYYYGDIIYRMDFIPNNDGSEGIVNIYYVLGGKLKDDNGILEYSDVRGINEPMPDFNEFVRNPELIKFWSVEKYLYIKNEFSKKENYSESSDIKFKGEYLNSVPVRTEDNKNEIWVYEVYQGDNNLTKGDYVITFSEKDRFYFTKSILSETYFSGIRLFEQKKWKMFNYRDSKYSINVLLNNYSIPKDIFEIDGLVSNATNVKIIDYGEMNSMVPCLFYSHGSSGLEGNCSMVALEQDFGKIETIIENSNDVVVDRGYVTSFELCYKLGEINTMEDMENYGNNFFGL